MGFGAGARFWVALFRVGGVVVAVFVGGFRFVNLGWLVYGLVLCA